MELLSHVLSAITFFRHVDGNRLQMASNHHIQSLPILNPDYPYTFTPYQMVHNTIFLIKSPIDGKVADIVNNNILIENRKDGSIKIITVPFYNDIVVNIGDVVEIGTILSKAKNIDKNGIILQGRNLNVAFNIYDGFTYEDAIVADKGVSEKLEVLYYEKIDILIEPKQILKLNYDLLPGNTYKGEIGSIHVQQFFSKIKDKIIFDEKYKIQYILTYIPDGAKTIYKHQPQKTKEFLDKYNIENRNLYGDLPVDIIETLKLHHKNIFSKKINGIQIVILGYKISKTKEGDKITNRHGNKGVISKLLNLNEAHSYDKNSYNVVFKPDLIFSPDGIRRMNLGQFEMHYCYILKELIPVITKGLLNSNLTKESVVDKIIKDFVIDEKAKIYFIKKIIPSVGVDSFIEYLLKYGLHVPIFNLENGNYLKKILDLMKMIKLPRYLKLEGNKLISYGVMYIHPLEHRVHEKLRASAVEENKGQRLGEQEMWSLIVSGQNKFIKEALIRSDDPEAHLKLLEDITLGIDKDIDSYVQSDKTLSISKNEFYSYLLALGVDLISISGEFDLSYLESYRKWKLQNQSEVSTDENTEDELQQDNEIKKQEV